MKCKNCKYWKPTTFYKYPGAVNEGKCSELQSKMTIELHTGWDGGYVDYIETEQDFGCVLFESKKIKKMNKQIVIERLKDNKLITGVGYAKENKILINIDKTATKEDIENIKEILNDIPIEINRFIDDIKFQKQ